MTLPTCKIINSDIIQWGKGHEWLVQNADGPFHFIFGDWPYNLESILKRFGGANSAPAQPGKDGSFQRQSAGFMGLDWDGSQLAYQASTWNLLARLLHPGGFTASFSHARKFHRLAMAQEEAGFILNPAIDTRIVPMTLAWLYSTGKPNGTSVEAGLQRGDHPLAGTWEGFQYGCPLAPEYEPIVIAQKPYSGNSVDSITRTGAGAYNIQAGKAFQTNGRFPGTVALVHHPECKKGGHREIKNNSGHVSGNEPSVSGKHVYGKQKRTSYKAKKGEGGNEPIPDYHCHPDCSVNEVPGPDKAHYFAQADWSWEVLECMATANPYFYEAKVGPRERDAGCHDLHNNHPTLKPIKLCQAIAALFLPPKEYSPRRVLVPCSGTGSEAIGCLLAGWDEIVMVESSPHYCKIAETRMKFFYEFVHYGQTDVDTILNSIAESNESDKDKQLSLLDLEEEMA